MLLTDQVRIQEVLLFPAMKPEDKVGEEEVAEHGPKVEEGQHHHKNWLWVTSSDKYYK